jgi:hypothetical protein
MSCWVDPFPLVRVRDGLSNELFDLAFNSAFLGAFLVMALALSGGGKPRLLLLASGGVLIFLTFGAMLQNGV